jgi:2,3-dihydroxybenzoate decarboxylase
MQDPDEAARELSGCVRELGFVGALVNGFSQAGKSDSAVYYDLPQFRPFWRTVTELDVPFYLHPRNPLAGRHSAPTRGHNWLLGPNWAFHAETAVHALRLIGSGLFDEHPTLQIILGHLGEGIPAYLWRIDHRNDWMKAPHKYAAKKRVADYFRDNFVLTTSGNFSTSALTRRSPRSASSACYGRRTIRSRTSATRPTGSTRRRSRSGSQKIGADNAQNCSS